MPSACTRNCIRRTGSREGAALAALPSDGLSPQQLPAAMANDQKAYSWLKVTVGIAHISITATDCLGVLRRDALQLCDGSLRPRIMYFEAVDWPPQRRTRAHRGSAYRPTVGFLARPPDQVTQASLNLRAPYPLPRFPALKVLKPARCQRITVSGFTTSTARKRVRPELSPSISIAPDPCHEDKAAELC
jgi:hypothetical protein